MIVPATPGQIVAAAELIQTGETVAFPTETVYGLGADATNAVAVARIFAIKARPSFDPLIVHIEPDWWSTLVTAIPPAAQKLAQRFWPGPLTIVLPKSQRIPDIVTAGLPSVAVRVPQHPVARALIARAGVPIAAPSANPFGYISPTTAAHVAEQIGDRVPIILDGGPCRIGLESTVVSFASAPPALLRPGAVTLEELQTVVGEIHVVTSSSRPSSPGQLDRHYAPRTPLTIVDDAEQVLLHDRASAALLSAWPVPIDGFRSVEILSVRGDLLEAAARLFAAMRQLDTGGYSRIFAVGVPEQGIGHAMMDRLRRAARG